MKEWADISLLVVDDEVELAELIAFEFELSGAKVYTAHNGEEALQVLDKNEDIDVIISDIRMPKIDGVQLLERIVKNDSIKANVILMTGFSDISIDKAYSIGAWAVFPKPFDRNDLIQAVKKITRSIESWGSEREKQDVVEVELSESFRSYDDAVQQHRISFGKGGFFYGKVLPQFSIGKIVSFDFEFEDKGSHNTSGLGIIRWIRREATDGECEGCGVEILSLNEQNKAEFIKVLNGNQSPAFIPLR